MAVINPTIDQGAALLGILENFAFPVDKSQQAKGKPGDPNAAAKIDLKAGRLRKTLHKVSPLIEKTGNLLFGAVEHYDEIKPTADQLKDNPDLESRWKPKDMKARTKVELDGDEARGLFWALYLTLAPEEERRDPATSKLLPTRRWPISLQHDVSWEILEQLERVGEMKEKLGIDVAEDNIGKSDSERKADAEIEHRRAEEKAKEDAEKKAKTDKEAK